MTPLSHTFYAVTLFFALVSLSLWGQRRHRMARIVKRAVTALVKDPQS